MDGNRGKGPGEARIYPNAGGVIDIQANHWIVEQSGRWIMRGKIRAPISGVTSRDVT